MRLRFRLEAKLKANRLRLLATAGALLALASGLGAQQSKLPTPAPVPEQIGAAQKVFISNAGGESFDAVTEVTVLNGGPDRPYNEFYAAVRDWARYDLVSSPTNADVVFEISWTPGPQFPDLGQLRLLIIDPKTRVTLWSFIEYVRGAALQSNRDKNFDQALNTIMSRLKQLTASPTPSSH
jgi:hypothetical protein